MDDSYSRLWRMSENDQVRSDSDYWTAGAVDQLLPGVDCSSLAKGLMKGSLRRAPSAVLSLTQRLSLIQFCLHSTALIVLPPSYKPFYL